MPKKMKTSPNKTAQKAENSLFTRLFCRIFTEHIPHICNICQQQSFFPKLRLCYSPKNAKNSFQPQKNRNFLLTDENNCGILSSNLKCSQNTNSNAMKRNSMQKLSPWERCRSVRGIGKVLRNSPQSGCRENTVMADGSSRNRVKM